MLVRDVISVRSLALVALGLVLLVTSVRAAHCDRSRDVLTSPVVTALADGDRLAEDEPLSHAPVKDGGTRDAACASTAAIVPARASSDARPETTTDASFLAPAFSPRRIGFALERPPRCC